jgi:hypothetical protein
MILSAIYVHVFNNLMRQETYTAATAAAGTSTTATAGPAATTGRVPAAGAFGTTLDVGALRLVAGLRLPSELNGDLTLQNLLARKLGDGALGLVGGRQVDEGITDRAVSARVLRNGNRLAVARTDAWLARVQGKKTMSHKAVLITCRC